MKQSQAESEQKVSPWVKGLVFLHLFLITSWTLPSGDPDSPNPIRRFLSWNKETVQTTPLHWYLLSVGMWQYWDMFAPDPVKRDIWMDAVVTYKDGREERFAYPRMAELGYVDKYLSERYRKFFERLNGDSMPVQWQSVAFCIAHKMDRVAGDPPVKVVLWRHWKDVTPPGTQQPKDYSTFAFYTYNVDGHQLDLAREGRLPE